MSIRRIKQKEISITRGRQKHKHVYDEWLEEAKTLKSDEALEITLDVSNPNLPSPRAAVLAIKRATLKCSLKDSRLKNPILYVYPQTNIEQVSRVPTITPTTIKKRETSRIVAQQGATLKVRPNVVAEFDEDKTDKTRRITAKKAVK